MKATAANERTLHYGDLRVRVFPTSADLGAAAAADLAAILAEAIARRGHVAMIQATGNSQLRYIEALVRRNDIAWDKVSLFHMDEYLGMDVTHPASFARYIRERLADVVHPQAFYPLRGDTVDGEAEVQRYEALLREHRPDVCVMGIGENGHLAFNDPPAAFDTPRWAQIVTLDEACRRQQMGEGWFPTLDDVPRQAITLTVPALLAPPQVLVVVPEGRKAAAVKAALEGPITPNCPASILQKQPHAVLYLDSDSASMLG